MATGSQPLVGAAGLGLVAVNYWTGPQRTDVDTLLNGQASATAHTSIVHIGSELMFVLALYLLAGDSPGMAQIMLAVLAALWVIWAIHSYGQGQTLKTQAPNSSFSTGSTNPAASVPASSTVTVI